MLRSLENLRDAGLRVSMCRQRSSIRPLSAGGSRAARLPDLRQPDAQGLQCGGHHLQGTGVPRDRLPPPPPPPRPRGGGKGRNSGGCGGYVVPDAWIPVTLRLRSEREVAGTVEVTASRARPPGTERVRVEVHLVPPTPHPLTVPVIVRDLRSPLA